MSLSFVLFLACTGSSTVNIPDPVDPASANSAAALPVDAPAKPAPSAPAAATAAIPAAADPAKFGDQWLVILGSNKARGQVPAGLDRLPTGMTVQTLDSSRFKGLMPCYEIVVAGAHADKKAALAAVTALKAAGIDSYAKPSGAFVKSDARVDAFCAGDAAPAAASCPQGLRFVVAYGGKSYLRLNLDPVESERALAGAPAPKALDKSKNAWAAPLAATTLGGLSVGDAMQVASPEGPTFTCKVASFSALTLGVPHFGYFEMGDGKAPGCGDAEVAAMLDCSHPTHGLAGPVGGGAPAYPPPVDADHTAAATKLAGTGAWSEALADATAVAAEQGEPLKTEHSAALYRVGDRELVLVTSTLSTRDGNDYCGMDDVHLRLVGLVDQSAGNSVVWPYTKIDGHEEARLIVAPDGAPSLEHGVFPQGRSILFNQGAATCRDEVAYCDCPC